MPLCRTLLFNDAFPLIPWHEPVQYVVFCNVNAGLYSVSLCILPDEWQSEQTGFVPGLLVEWLAMVLLAASMNGNTVDTLLWHW